MASNRHISRVAVVQALFAWEVRGKDAEGILDYILDQFYPKLVDRKFPHENLKGVLEKRETIKEIIAETAPEWAFEKIAPIDRVILELGVFEIINSEEVPPIVAINEAIEIAKEFGGENSAKFINGVLSTVMKKYRPISNESK
ncbi:MAG: transcription antitermination factor NusB [uncultured bacterium]|nr:MAG: transcription antitermination factor NusB [uncultured bacterium]KKT72971.1 MAG: N utilization substance protein B-like protein [Candidatus Peregrinibacteria bacterium GW2011_GWA2_44_7]